MVAFGLTEDSLAVRKNGTNRNPMRLFAEWELYETLEEPNEIRQLPSSQRQPRARSVRELLKGQWEGPATEQWCGYKRFLYHAASRKRRVVGEDRVPLREIVPPRRFIVANLSAPNWAVVRFCNKHGAAGQKSKEGKKATKLSRLNCYCFRANQAGCG